jgi:hypothetical protein
MFPPIFLVGIAIAGGLAILKRSSSSTAPVAATTDLALIDPSEKTHPNAELARRAIVVAMHLNSRANYELTAVAIEQQLRMPKTAANVRIWATMAVQGGQTVAGEDSYGDDVSGSDGYGDDEVGARRKVVRKILQKHRAAKAKPKPRPKARPARLTAAKQTARSPAVDWAPDDDDGGGNDDEGGGFDDEADDDDEVGASGKPKRLPDWLRFSATQSKLAGDPRFIRATAQVMQRMGYAAHAKIHLQALAEKRI